MDDAGSRTTSKTEALGQELGVGVFAGLDRGDGRRNGEIDKTYESIGKPSLVYAGVSDFAG
jgi:hypothetical protein